MRRIWSICIYTIYDTVLTATEEQADIRQHSSEPVLPQLQYMCIAYIAYINYTYIEIVIHSSYIR